MDELSDDIILSESTTAASIATVAQPLHTQSRNNVGTGIYNTKGGKLFVGKKTKKYNVETEMKHTIKENSDTARKKDDDYEVAMARSDLIAAFKSAKAIYQMLKTRTEEDGIEGWVQEKLIKANDYLTAVKEYYDEERTVRKSSSKITTEMTAGVIAGGGVGEDVNEERDVSENDIKRWAMESTDNKRLYDAYTRNIKLANQALENKDYRTHDLLQAKRKHIRNSIIQKMEEGDLVESKLTEKSKSKSQQRLFGMIAAAQSGKKPASKKVAKMAKTISKSDVKDFASTKHKKLPNKVEESLVQFENMLNSKVNNIINSLTINLNEDASLTPTGVSASTKMFLEDDVGEPSIKKVNKKDSDGSLVTRWEVLDYRGKRATGQGKDGFNSRASAKKFLEKNMAKLSSPEASPTKVGKASPKASKAPAMPPLPEPATPPKSSPTSSGKPSTTPEPKMSELPELPKIDAVNQIKKRGKLN